MTSMALLFVALVGLASSTVYVALAAAAAVRFRARTMVSLAAAKSGSPVPVTVLKPLHGSEPQLEACLESFFRQEYQSFEIIFGARDSDDKAWDVVDTLERRYPHVKSRRIVCGEPVYPNAKVSALETMVAHASFRHIVIADSDARVPPDCLTRVVGPLADPDVGLVTCLYRGVPTGGLCSRLEALGMSVEMPSGVLVADMLEGMRFALGPTVATRTDVLRLIGGIRALGPYCADDYVLGHLTHAAGMTVVLSDQVIDHLALNRSFRASMQHQIRWMRSTRFSRPWGHLGTALTFAMPFGILGLASAGAGGHWMLGVGLACWAIANRVIQSLMVGWLALRDREACRWAWLYPVRDLLGFCVWCGSFIGTHIVWRGEQYELSSGGRMRRQSREVSAL